MSSGSHSVPGALQLTPDEVHRLRLFEQQLQRWSSVKNLVSKASIEELWLRHIIDSAQVQKACPDAMVWADLGSGGGLPGVVTGILLSRRPAAVVHLVESDNRKCAFLRHVSRETGACTVVHHGRIEDVVPTLVDIEAVSARALAQMDQLLDWASPLLEKGAVGVFPKGKTARIELTRLSTTCRFDFDLRPSLTDPDASLVVVRRKTLLETPSATS